MTIAFTCVLIAIVLPYVWAYYAKRGLMSGRTYDNSAPRLQLAELTGAEARANWAQQNTFEALPGFIGAVIIAHLGDAAQITVDTLAVIFIIARLGHGVCYIRDLATLRSSCWAVGFFAVIGLFIAAF
jgi:uncharacterized MAPEG superfamily protein